MNMLLKSLWYIGITLVIVVGIILLLRSWIIPGLALITIGYCVSQGGDFDEFV